MNDQTTRLFVFAFHSLVRLAYLSPLSPWVSVVLLQSRRVRARPSLSPPLPPPARMYKVGMGGEGKRPRWGQQQQQYYTRDDDPVLLFCFCRPAPASSPSDTQKGRYIKNTRKTHTCMQ